MAIDRNQFLASCQGLFGGDISGTQKAGLTAILAMWESAPQNDDDRWLAYMLATAFHETARTMQPVKEAFWLSEQWRKDHLRYYPYYGRGYVQLTWQANYKKASPVVGVDLVSNPDLAMRPDVAAVVMDTGMREGWFRTDIHGRSHNLARYLNNNSEDPIGAREIINGHEWKIIKGSKVLVATMIAGYYQEFVRALQGKNVSMIASGDETFPDTSQFAAMNATEADALDASAVDTSSKVSHNSDLVSHTAQIVTGYVSNNTIPHQDIPAMIASIHSALQTAATPAASA